MKDPSASPRVVFLQKRSHQASAQSSLVRILKHWPVPELAPVVVTESPGWLSEACEGLGVQMIFETFPGRRSLAERAFGNAQFVRRLFERLKELGAPVAIVHANNHPESPLALGLARKTKARSAVTLRSSSLSAQDFGKYRCPDHDVMIAVSADMADQAKRYAPKSEVRVISDGLSDEEFMTPRPITKYFPRCVLGIGSHDRAKGWTDLAAALRILEREPEFQDLSVDLTDGEADGSIAIFGSLRRIKTRFIGQPADFSSLVRRYGLVLHPSRSESFGMAALETIAAGVPLLSSHTGVIPQILDPELMFAPGNPILLAERIRWFRSSWPVSLDRLLGSQSRLRTRFSIEDCQRQLKSTYEDLWRPRS